MRINHMEWGPLTESQIRQISTLETVCACPILSATAKLGAGGEERPGSLREWYLACSDEPQLEPPLVKHTIAKVIKVCVKVSWLYCWMR